MHDVPFQKPPLAQTTLVWETQFYPLSVNPEGHIKGAVIPHLVPSK